MKTITIFTDGASSGNPGPGGYGAIIITENRVAEVGGFEKDTTNNRMEMRAAITALAFAEKNRYEGVALLYTDSNYLINGITKWVKGWQKSGWKTKTNEEVSNKDLWEELVSLTRKRNVNWKYLGGHVGIVGNERADEIATSFANHRELELFDGLLSEYDKDILNIEYDETKASEKSVSRSHSKAKAYSYLSLVDGKLEHHVTWAECEKRVKGKKAKFRKATSADDEKTIMKEWGVH